MFLFLVQFVRGPVKLGWAGPLVTLVPITAFHALCVGLGGDQHQGLERGCSGQDSSMASSKDRPRKGEPDTVDSIDACVKDLMEFGVEFQEDVRHAYCSHPPAIFFGLPTTEDQVALESRADFLEGGYELFELRLGRRGDTRHRAHNGGHPAEISQMAFNQCKLARNSAGWSVLKKLAVPPLRGALVNAWG